MPFSKGKSGNPNGAPRGAKLWRDAVRLIVNRRDEDGMKVIDKLARQLLASAMAGDISAIKEIGDRLDGKPGQAISGPDGGPMNIAVSWMPPTAKQRA